VGVLCASGLVKKVVYGFVTLDSIALDPHFRAARQSGSIEAMEVDEGMFYLGLLAASQRLPFLPTRAGLGSDVLRVNPELRTVTSPYADGEELVAMPALALDAAFVHLNRADTNGNGQILGPTPSSTSCSWAPPPAATSRPRRWSLPGRCSTRAPSRRSPSDRLSPTAVAEVPGGAHFTSCPPTTTATRPSRSSTPDPVPIPMPGSPSPSVTSRWTKPGTRRRCARRQRQRSRSRPRRHRDRGHDRSDAGRSGGRRLCRRLAR